MWNHREVECELQLLDQQVSTLLIMPWPFNRVPHVMGTSSHKIILLLLHNCGFATVVNHSVFRVLDMRPLKVVSTHRLEAHGSRVLTKGKEGREAFSSTTNRLF